MPRNKKYWKRRLGNMITDDMPAYWQHLDMRSINDLDDEGLAYVLTHIKGIGMLDLDGTEITNEGIRLLTRLEYIKELRLKDVNQIDDGCANDLNKIKGLELLHLGYTSFTIDGVLKLNALTNLKKIIFSVNDITAITEKMLQLKAMFPGCGFIVNSKPYYFEDEEA